MKREKLIKESLYEETNSLPKFADEFVPIKYVSPKGYDGITFFGLAKSPEKPGIQALIFAVNLDGGDYPQYLISSRWQTMSDKNGRDYPTFSQYLKSEKLLNHWDYDEKPDIETLKKLASKYGADLAIPTEFNSVIEEW
jgi:hypothetical protein